MSYQPLNWDIDKLIRLREEKFDLIDLYQTYNLKNVERFTFDRAVAIANFLRDKKEKKVTVLDLGSSGGVFSVVLKMTMDSHVTAVDDDRYILIQDEDEDSSIERMRGRLDQKNIPDIITVNSSIETFLQELPAVPLYDVVLLLNVLHHYYTGYGQCSDYGQLKEEDIRLLINKLGIITNKYLFFEVNSLLINGYETYLSDIMYQGGFKKIEYVTRSCATDGKIRIVWCFIK